MAVFHMKVDELQAFWLGRVFRGELPAPPRAFASDVSVRQYVAANPRAIGYVDAALLDETVKGLRIDGKRPGRELTAAMLAEKVAIGRTWPALPNHVRVTIGTRDEMAKFKAAFEKVLGG